MARATVSTATYVPTATAVLAHALRVARQTEEENDLDELMRENLERELKRLKMTRYRLARSIGADPSTFSKILSSKDRGIGKMMLYKLRRAGVSVDALMSGALPSHPRPPRPQVLPPGAHQ